MGGGLAAKGRRGNYNTLPKMNDSDNELPIPPAVYSKINDLGFCEGAVIKCVTAHRAANGRQDLERAIHFLGILIATKYPAAQPNRY